MRLSVYQHVAVPGLVRSKPDPSKEIHELTLGEKPVELRHDTRQHADSAPPLSIPQRSCVATHGA